MTQLQHVISLLAIESVRLGDKDLFQISNHLFHYRRLMS